MNKDLRKLMKALEQQGFEVRLTSKGHLMVYRDGRAIATLSGTASDHRSLRNGIAKLRNAGFYWPRK
jgi:hypothetical protein